MTNLIGKINANYQITQVDKNLKKVVAYNSNRMFPYVVWSTDGNNFFWGHYFATEKDCNRYLKEIGFNSTMSLWVENDDSDIWLEAEIAYMTTEEYLCTPFAEV